MAVDVLVVDDGSRDRTADDRPRGGRRGHLATATRAGSAPRCGPGWSTRASDGYAAAVYLDGDGEYDAAELPAVLEPVARGRADYVLGSRFLGDGARG